jgi:hypothetical protein
MDQDKKLEQTFKEYQDVAKENPNVDMAALMINSLQNQNQNLVSSKAKHWAYIISIGLPPFGLLFAAKYYFLDNRDDAKSVGNICVILTLISVAAFYLLGKMLFSSSGTSIEQIQQIKPSDIQQLYQ